MKTVKEVSQFTGVSVRILHHYDAIGLLCPSGHSDTDAYKESEKKRKQGADFGKSAQEMMAIFARFGELKNQDPAYQKPKPWLKRCRILLLQTITTAPTTS